MAGIAVQANTPMAHAIQGIVQPKLLENGWVAEENDTTLSEYVTMMLVNGKDVQGVTSELGGDLLGMGEEDPAVEAFARWLFDQVRAMTAPPVQQQEPGSNAEMQHQQQEDGAQAGPTAQDSQMDDATPPAEGVPSGPKAMRNGSTAGRGRDRRMLGHMNNHLNSNMNRSELPDPLRRIKGAASGQHGRINAHASRDPPRGPRGNLANGMQRVMSGGGRSAYQVGAMGSPMNPMMQQSGVMNQLDPQQQMQFMQMMEVQANMMSQMLQNGGMPGTSGQQQNVGGQGKSMFDRVEKRGGANGHFKGRQHLQQRNSESQDGDASSSGMDVDKPQKGEPFDTTCRFNGACTSPSCPYAHQSPAAPLGQILDMNDTCAFGAACENRKCAGRHPSPAQRAQHLKQDVDCKFFPNCTNASCPFRHPDMPPCRNGADCQVEGCKFTHSKIMCRYTPCTKPFCPFKHVEGQKGVFKDKVWTAGFGGGEGQDGAASGGDTTSTRFAELKENEGQAEELIIPGQQQQTEAQQQEQQPAEQAVPT